MTISAEFEIEYIQYLDPDGKLTSPLPKFAEDSDKLIQLYKLMTQLRAYDTKAIALQRTGKMGTYASTLGQEAIGVAIGHAMQKHDVLAPFYRDHGAMLQRGIKMSDIYSYWGGDERGSAYEKNPDDLPICVPIASQCLHAAGVASAFKMRGQKRVAVTTIGDGGTSEGDFYEAMNVAGAWQLPVVFVINNNQWAISVPLSKQTACETLAQKAIAAGFKGIQVDGNDVIAMRETIANALDKARTGNGPTLIEALTYRLCDHTTADDATRYRNSTEVDAAWKLEPLKRLQQYLISENLWDDTKQQTLEQECNDLVDQAVKEYTGMAKQDAGAIFDFHYESLPHDLELQRNQLMEEINHD